MSFEQSPQLENGVVKSRQSLHGWLMQHERGLYAVTGVLLVIMAVMTAWFFGFSLNEPGGVDGCVVNAGGEPAEGSVQVELQQSPLYEDGCFFVAELPSGPHDLIIQTLDGKSTQQVVVIVSGEAVGLGTVTIP